MAVISIVQALEGRGKVWGEEGEGVEGGGFVTDQRDNIL